MTLPQQIYKWLNQDGSYIEGVALYRLTGGSYPARFFEHYEQSPFIPEDIEQRLRYSLSGYIEAYSEEELQLAPIPPPDQMEAPEAAEKPTVKKSNAIQKHEPEPIAQLRQKAKMLHKRQAYLHAQLGIRIITEDAEEETPFIPELPEATRYKIAEEIMETVIPQLDNIYDQIRVWENTGELPPVALIDDVVARVVKKMQRVSTLKSRLSRIKGLLKKTPLEVEHLKLEQEQLEKKAELESLKRELGLQ